MNENFVSIGYLSGKVHGLIKARVQHYLDASAIGLKMEWYPILHTLWKQDGVTQQWLSDKLGYDRHRMSRLLDVLEAGGWILRQDHPNSRREKMITLTAFARQQKKGILDCVQAGLNDATQGFSSERKERFIADLQQVIHNLS